MNPDEIREQIVRFLIELSKAPDALHEYELDADVKDEEAERAQDIAFLSASGNVEERKAQARLASYDERQIALIAKAALTRVKTKTRQLEQSIVANQALLKSVQRDGA